MAMTSTTNPAANADRLQTYFSKKLLEIQLDKLVFDQFGMKADLPANMRSKTIRFFKFRLADETQVEAQTEGVVTTTYTENASTYVECTLIQYAEKTKLTDIYQAIDAYQPLKQNIEAMGRDSALHADGITRNAIMGTVALGAGVGLYNSNSNSERFAGVPATLNSANDFATLSGTPAANSKWTRGGGLGAVTTLEANNAPTHSDGSYVALICPQVKFDMLQDQTLVDAMTRSAVQKLWKGEIGLLDNVRYVVHTNPFRENVQNTPLAKATASGADTIFTTLYLGANGYGTPKLAGTSSPFKPSVSILDKADKTDPLNQYTIAGWKSFWNALLLDRLNVVAFRSKATFA